MPTTVYVVAAPPTDRRWIEAALARTARIDVVFLDDKSSLLANPPSGRSCVVAMADAGEVATLALVRDLRSRGSMLAVIVLGSHTAFRMAVEIARLPATDFLERPVSAHQLRAAVLRACADT
mgnify:CR=1 FL=1